VPGARIAVTQKDREGSKKRHRRAQRNGPEVVEGRLGGGLDGVQVEGKLGVGVGDFVAVNAESAASHNVRDRHKHQQESEENECAAFLYTTTMERSWRFMKTT